MLHLRGVDHRGGAAVDHAKRRHQGAGIDVGRQIGRGEGAADVALIVGIEETVGEDVPQYALVAVVVRVDEARNDDAVGGVDNRHIARRDVGANVTNPAVLDQHVGLGEVADLPVEREHDAALNENAARALHASEFGVGTLRLRGAGQDWCRGGARRERSAQLKKIAA